MIVNMLVDLAHPDFQGDAEIPKALSGIASEKRRGVSDAERDFIDATFGGSWASEARAGWNWLAQRDGAPVEFHEHCCGARVVERLTGPLNLDVPADKCAISPENCR